MRPFELAAIEPCTSEMLLNIAGLLVAVDSAYTFKKIINNTQMFLDSGPKTIKYNAVYERKDIGGVNKRIIME